MTSILFHNDTGSLNHLWFESHKRLLTSVCIDLGNVERIDEFVAKYLGDKLKIKTLKDPNRPKRAKTAYLFFCNAKQAFCKGQTKQSGFLGLHCTAPNSIMA